MRQKKLKMRRLCFLFYLLLIVSCNPLRVKSSVYISPDNYFPSKTAVLIESENQEKGLDETTLKYYLPGSSSNIRIGLTEELDKTVLNQYLKEKLDYALQENSVIYFDRKLFAKESGKYDDVLHIKTKINRESSRTFILELLHAGSYFILPIPVFNWGTYTVEFDVTYAMKSDEKINRMKYVAESDFSMIFYSELRTSPNEKALSKAFDSNFSRLAKDIANIRNGKKAEELLSVVKIEEPEDKVHIIRNKSALDSAVFTELRRYQGTTIVKAYKENGGKGAEGKGTIKEYDLFLTTKSSKTLFYYAPQAGFFSRSIKLKDFGKDVSDINSGKDGFIPGITTNPDTAQELDISSLSYKADFKSLYLGLRGGLNLTAGTNNMVFFLNPSIFLNFLEYRTTIVDNGERSFKKSQFQIPDFNNKPFINSLGLDFDTGIYFPVIRTGFRAGIEYSYFREFEFERAIEFRENYFDEEMQLHRQRRISVESSQITATRFYLSLFFKLWGSE